MAEGEIRISDMTASSGLTNDDNFVVDKAGSNGTKKFSAADYIANKTELVGIRVGANGETYPSAGDAVRAQAVQNSQSILGLTETTAYEDGMYYAVAKSGGGTKKIDANKPSTVDSFIEKSVGVDVFSEFKHGVVTASMTPSENNSYKYTIIKRSDFEQLSVISDTTYNILYKVSLFNAEKERLATMANWTLVENGQLLDFSIGKNYPLTGYYYGITICYSTTTSNTDAIANVPLLDLALSTSQNPLYEDISTLKSETSTYADDLYKNKKIVGGVIYNDFQSGRVDDHLTPTSTDSTVYKYIIIDTQEMLYDTLYVDWDFEPISGYVLVGDIVWYDANGTKILDGSFKVLNKKQVVARKTIPSYPNLRYVTLTVCFATDATRATTTDFPEGKLLYETYFLNTLFDRVAALENVDSPFVIVDANGSGDYTTINAAIEGTTDGTTIIIMPSTYNEDVQMWGKNRSLIGIDRDRCIIYSGSGDYATPALEANIGYIRNLTIISGNDNSYTEESTISKSYGVHVEYANTEAYEIIFENCKIVSALNSAIGIGCRHNQTIILNNCYLETLASKTYSSYYSTLINSSALLFHNDANVSGAQDKGLLILNNCEMKGITKAIMCQSMENNSEMIVRFNKCLAYIDDEGTTDIVGFWGSSQKGISPYFCGTDIILDKLSYGNNSNEIDFSNYWNN